MSKQYQGFIACRGPLSATCLLALASFNAGDASAQVSATPASETPVVPTGGPPEPGYTLKFDDEFTSFNGDANGSNGWKTQYNFGRTNNVPLEAEYYSDSSVGTNPFSMVNGTLQISATTVASTGANSLGLSYNSGIITSFNSFHMQYGYFEISAQMPPGIGLWPAFWLLPEGGGWPPEIDVMEQIGAPTTIYQTLHFISGGNAQEGIPVSVADTTATYHTYGVDWEPSTITIYFDGQPTARWPTPADMNQPMYMLLNLAVGGPGSWPGPPNSSTVFPANMNIDYVRAYASPNSIDIGGALAL
jgi:beta-glucanase (GH16 family)